MVQALKAKEVDLTWSTPLPNIPELKGLESQGITTLVQPGTGAERYVFNGDHTQVPLFADKELRMALSLAVDRKTIVDKLLFGLTTIARGDWDNTPWENTQLKLVEYNPEQAKQIAGQARLEARLGWHPRQGRPAAVLRPHHHLRHAAPRERPASGSAELQGRRRRDDDPEPAQQRAVRQLSAGGALGARQLPDGRLVPGHRAAGSGHLGPLPHQGDPLGREPVRRLAVPLLQPGRSTRCSGRPPPSSIRRSARRSSSRSRR